MTPMRANSDNKIAEQGGESSPSGLNFVSDTAADSLPGELSVFKVPAAGMLSSAAAARLECSAIEGTSRRSRKIRTDPDRTRC